MPIQVSIGTRVLGTAKRKSKAEIDKIIANDVRKRQKVSTRRISTSIRAIRAGKPLIPRTSRRITGVRKTRRKR